MYVPLALAVFWLAQLLVRADNAFSYPPSTGCNATEGSQVTIEWTTDWGVCDIWLVVYQEDPASSWGWESCTLLENVQDPGYYVWTAETIDGISIAHGFHFMVQLSSSSDDDDSNLFNSGALFIVTESASTSSEYSTTYTSASSTWTSQQALTSTSSTAKTEWLTSTTSTSTTGTKTSSSPSRSQTTSSTTTDTMWSNPSTSTTTTITTPSPSSSTTTTTTTHTTNNNNGSPLSKAAEICTIVGAILAVPAAFATLWLALRKDKDGNRALPRTIRSIRGNLSRGSRSRSSEMSYRSRW